MKKQLIPMNLQYFADEPDPADTGSSTGGENKDQSSDNNDSTGDVFTQDDLTRVGTKENKQGYSKALKDAGYESMDDLKNDIQGFKEYQESQQTDAEKQTEALETANTQISELSKDLANAQSQNAALKTGVNPDSVGDVIALANNYVNEEVSIDDAIKQVVDKYPNFLNAPEEEPNKPRFVNNANPGSTSKTETTIMDDILSRYK